ncbi:MAG: type II toxin-antitoxin system VapC family toxin [Stellaceae bacterium]
MTDRLLLDTYIVLWLDSGDERLSITTRALIDDCWRNGGTLYFSAVTAWEIALLVDTGRVDLDSPPKEWVERFLDRPGIEPVPLGWRAACQAYRLHPLAHRDPADRLLIATAIDLGCPLVTYDERIAGFAGMHGRQYGFVILA